MQRKVWGIMVNESIQKVSNKVFTFTVRRLLRGMFWAFKKLIFNRKKNIKKINTK